MKCLFFSLFLLSSLQEYRLIPSFVSLGKKLAVKQSTLNFEKPTGGTSTVDLSTLRLVPELAPSPKN